MAMRHVVIVSETFSHTVEQGPLMVGDRQVAPAGPPKTFTYKEGDRIQFRTKDHAVGFCKAHGFDKLKYLGKVQV